MNFIEACKAAEEGKEVKANIHGVVYRLSIYKGTGIIVIETDDKEVIVGTNVSHTKADWQEEIEYFDFFTAMKKLEAGETVMCDGCDDTRTYRLNKFGEIIKSNDITGDDWTAVEFIFNREHRTSKKWRVYDPRTVSLTEGKTCKVYGPGIFDLKGETK
jgi:hypothetical protein